MAHQKSAGIDVAAEPDVQQLIEDLARAHRTPRGVEQFGIEVVPKSLRTARWNDIFILWFGSMLSPGLMLLPAMAVVNDGLSYWQAILAIWLGSWFGCLVFAALSSFGPDYGLPGQMLVRSIFGIAGTRLIISVLRLFCGCYWFAFQTIATAFGVRAILETLTGAAMDLVAISLLLGIGQAVLAIFGFEVLRKAGRLILPVMLVVMAAMLYVFVTSGGPDYGVEYVISKPSRTSSWLPMLVWVGTMISTWLPVTVSCSDVSRYARSRPHAWLGTAFGPALGMTTAAVVSAYGAVASGEWNPFGLAARLAATGPLPYLLLGGLILAVVLANTMNLYSAGLSFVNIVPSVGRFWATLSMAVLSIGLCLLPAVVINSQSYITELGRVFGPVAGVLLADYLVIKRGRVEVAALLVRGGRYRYFRDVNVVAIIAWALGYGLFAILPPWSVPVAASLFATGIIYLIAMSIASRLSVAYRSAVAPSALIMRLSDA